MTTSGWGSQAWGLTCWGGASLSSLTLLRAIAVRENVVRLVFSQKVYFSTILDRYDAWNPIHYSIASVVGTLDANNEPTHEVSVIAVERPNELSSPPVLHEEVGFYIDLVVDRPFSSHPAQYMVTANQLANEDRSLTLTSETASFESVYRELTPPTLEAAAEVRDIAMPQTFKALNEASPDELTLIGSYVVDDTGDYSFDTGNTGRKKRVFRRTFTKKGGFAHLPGYGLGIMTYGKKLGTLARIGTLQKEAELQIIREPDIQKIIVAADIDDRRPNLLRLSFAIKPRGQRSEKFTTEIPIK